LLAAAGCGKVFPLFPEQAPSLRAGEGLKEAKIRIQAKDYACDPSVIALDRDGRALKVIFTVTSIGAEHVFLIPDLDIRRTIPAGQESTIEFVADRSGIFEFGCSRFPSLWMNPLEKRGKLAIK
jgi:plastocyanin domain-containing protein